MDTLDSLLPYDAAGIYVVHHDPHMSEGGTQTLIFHAEAVRGYDIDELLELRLRAGEGVIGHVAATGETVVVPDVREDPRYVNARRETRSEMVAPIFSNDEVIGVFDLESDQINAYAEDDMQMLQLLASQVAIIVEKAMLHDQVVEKKRLEAQLEVARQVQLSLLRRTTPCSRASISAPTTSPPKKCRAITTTSCPSTTAWASSSRMYRGRASRPRS